MHAHSLKHIKAVENRRYHTFFNLAIFLAALTGIEIVAIFLPFMRPALLVLLVGCSIIKFFGVIMWFMHLIYDRPLLLWVFITGLAIAIGTVLALMELFVQSDVDVTAHAMMEGMRIEPKAWV